jgi:hypothetical protein
MAVVWHCGRVTTKTGANLSMTIRGSCGDTFRGLIKGASRVLCPISVDDDLVHPVSLDVITGSLASLIALEGAIGNCGGVGRRVRVYSLNEASAVDFDSSEPGGLCFPARGVRWASERDGGGELEELLGDRRDVEKVSHGCEMGGAQQGESKRRRRATFGGGCLRWQSPGQFSEMQCGSMSAPPALPIPPAPIR